MKCLAIGDMFISAKCFEKALADSALFEEYHCLSWKEDEDRKTARETIRRIETKGAQAFPLEPAIYEAVQEAEVIFVHLCPVPRALMEKAHNLKYIVTARGGVENIDMAAAHEMEIPVIHCPAHNAYAVAEYCIGLMLCEMRNIARSDRSLRQGIWREQFPNSGKIIEMRSATVGLIGFGAIGRLVAERLAVFGCRILINDPYVPEEEIRMAGCLPVSKEELLKQADVVSLHGRIAAGDPPIIGKEEFQKMKPEAYLINTARAMLLDMEALYFALKEKQIRGAAVDVFPVEPLPEGEKLLELDNLTLTNHRGGDTVDSYIKTPELLVKQLKELLATGHTRYLIR